MVFTRLWEIISGPFVDPIMWWEIGPLLITMVISELYFSRYRKEPLGWNSAVSNSLVLFFVGSNLLHFLYLEGLLDFRTARTWMVLVLLSLGVLLFVINYFHRWPARVAFGISSALIINTFAFATTIVVHLGLPFSGHTFVAMILLLFCFFVIFFVVDVVKEPVDEAQ